MKNNEYNGVSTQIAMEEPECLQLYNWLKENNDDKRIIIESRLQSEESSH